MRPSIPDVVWNLTVVGDTEFRDDAAARPSLPVERSGVAGKEGKIRDYSIIGPERDRATERGLAGAQWYATPVPREQMRPLMERRNGPAVRATALWVGLLVGSGYLAHRSFGTWWMVPTFFVYGTLYGSTSDARWHECAHRTAFRSMWMNEIVYNVSSFMAFREPVSWRWSHVRHHSDTIIVGRDIEIAYERPMRLRVAMKECFGLLSGPREVNKVLLNVSGRLSAEELDYIPVAEQPKAIRAGRVTFVLWGAALSLAVVLQSVEPLLFVVGPSFYGRWLLVAYGITQHAGLAEDTLDHRLNSRSVRMNRIHRFLYLNMNYHAEHHMFPSVPYYSLPALHLVVQDDFPPILSGFRAAYREIWGACRLQQSDPTSFVDRSSSITTSAELGSSSGDRSADAAPMGNGWFDVGPATMLRPTEVVRADVGDRTFALYRLSDGSVAATDGLCTHGKVHLCDGLVIDGQIECPKHNGRFDIVTGRALKRPATVNLATHPARERDGRLEICWLDS